MMNHLTDEQVDEIRQQLTEARSGLRSSIREELLRADNEQYSDLAGQVHDDGDDSVADLLIDTNIATVSRLISELRETEAALERIHQGSYGLCEDCGSEIPWARLKAQPTARRDIEHQERFERTFSGQGRPSI